MPDKAELQAIVLEKRVTALERLVDQLEKAARASGDTAKKLNALEAEAKAAKDQYNELNVHTREGLVVQKSFRDRELQREAEYKKRQADSVVQHQESLKQGQVLAAQAAKVEKQAVELQKIMQQGLKLEQRFDIIETQLKTLMALVPLIHKAGADATHALALATAALKH